MTKPLYRYVGRDTFHGVPARDLTAEEFQRLPILRQLDVKANASYELVEDLASKTRDDLITLATQLGVEDPEKLKNKDALVAAIEAAQQGQEGN